MSLIDNIYHGTYATMPNAKEAEKKITEEVETCMEPLRERLTEDQYEAVGDFVFQATNIAQQEGFRLGMQYLLKLLLECVS